MIDLTPDGKTGRSALAMFTFKKGQYIQNWLQGVNDYFTCAAA
jgi:hypothetical protein